MYGYVYLTTNLINNKKYVGLHRSSTFDENYKGSGKILLQAIEKYGWENFKTEVLIECNSPEELSQREAEEIERRDAVNSPEYYNIKQGGFGGWKINGVSIKKGVIITEEARRNTSLAHLGVPLSPEHRKSISRSLMGDRNPLRCKGSEVARKHLSESMKGNQNGKGTIWITDGVVDTTLKEGQEMPEGFRVGKSHPGYLNYKYRWVTKDKQNLRVRESDVDKYLADGYKVGRYIPRRSATTIESVDGEKSSIE